MAKSVEKQRTKRRRASSSTTAASDIGADGAFAGEESRTIATSQLATDQLTLHQQLTVQRRQCFHINVVNGAMLNVLSQRGLNHLHDLKSHIGSITRDERKTGDVASQTNSAGDHNI